MDMGRYLTSLLLLAITFIGSTLLVTNLTGFGYVFELLVLIALLVIGFVSFYGFSTDAGWAESLFSVFFIAALVNLIILFIILGISFTFMVTLIVAILGILVSVGSFRGRRLEEFPIPRPKEPEFAEKVKDYEEKKEPMVIVEDLKPKARKKSVMKKATKKKTMTRKKAKAKK